jgi:tRNA threonylcarbamoyladenosine biosynthesis protein TsaE
LERLIINTFPTFAFYHKIQTIVCVHIPIALPKIIHLCGMEMEFSLLEVSQAAATLWQYGKHAKVWAFHGEMGAGKTTFIHMLCSQLQTIDVVSSPTFAIINEYQTQAAGTVFHMDWYRLSGEEEAIQAGIEDCLLSGQLCLVEWPEKAAGLLPDNTLHIYLRTTQNQNRLLEASLKPL